ncbi:hypothetical protein L9G16_06980 [Shewanella sp. A25]|nr:hypothetical protein [Shewanella shenzhenensis]
MFSSFKQKIFKPLFPIIELESSPDEVFSLLSGFSPVEKIEGPDEKGVDYAYIARDSETQISVGFVDEQISYVNYLTNQFNRSHKEKALKLDWFLNHYGKREEYEEPSSTPYMVFVQNPKRKITIVLGLHMGPIRINNLSVGSKNT